MLWWIATAIVTVIALLWVLAYPLLAGIIALVLLVVAWLLKRQIEAAA